jgi:hypothetical protein
MKMTTQTALLLAGFLALTPAAWAGDDHNHGTKEHQTKGHDHAKDNHRDHEGQNAHPEKEGEKHSDHGHINKEEQSGSTPNTNN